MDPITWWVTGVCILVLLFVGAWALYRAVALSDQLFDEPDGSIEPPETL